MRLFLDGNQNKFPISRAIDTDISKRNLRFGHLIWIHNHEAWKIKIQLPNEAEIA